MAIDPVRVGVIGTTAYAETHMANVVKHPAAVFRAVAGRDRGRTRAIAERYGAELVYEGYNELIESGEVDAVFVLAPDDLHEQIALESFAAGIHVLCEKPLAPTAAAARRMADAARESGLVNMSYFALRTSPHHHLSSNCWSRRDRAGQIGVVHPRARFLPFTRLQLAVRFVTRRRGRR